MLEFCTIKVTWILWCILLLSIKSLVSICIMLTSSMYSNVSPCISCYSTREHGLNLYASHIWLCRVTPYLKSFLSLYVFGRIIKKGPDYDVHDHPSCNVWIGLIIWHPMIYFRRRIFSVLSKPMSLQSNHSNPLFDWIVSHMFCFFVLRSSRKLKSKSQLKELTWLTLRNIEISSEGVTEGKNPNYIATMKEDDCMEL